MNKNRNEWIIRWRWARDGGEGAPIRHIVSFPRKPTVDDAKRLIPATRDLGLGHIEIVSIQPR